jgi:hypothetical protein
VTILHARGHDRSAAANAFGIEVGVLFRNPGFHHRTDNPTDGTACNRPSNCASRSRGKPAGCNDGTDTRDGKHAKAGQETACTASERTDPSAGASTFPCLVTLPFYIEIAIRLVGDDADVV